MQITTTAPCIAPVGGGTQQSSIQEAPPQGPTPYPLKYHFDRKGTTYVYLLLTKYGTPLISHT